MILAIFDKLAQVARFSDWNAMRAAFQAASREPKANTPCNPFAGFSYGVLLGMKLEAGRVPTKNQIVAALKRLSKDEKRELLRYLGEQRNKLQQQIAEALPTRPPGAKRIADRQTIRQEIQDRLGHGQTAAEAIHDTVDARRKEGQKLSERSARRIWNEGRGQNSQGYVATLPESTIAVNPEQAKDQPGRDQNRANTQPQSKPRTTPARSERETSGQRPEN
jgi:hypothetical protein